MSMEDVQDMKRDQRHRQSDQAAAQRGPAQDDLHQHVDDLAVLTRALYVYVRSQPGFDPVRFAEIVAHVQKSVTREGEKPSA